MSEAKFSAQTFWSDFLENFEEGKFKSFDSNSRVPMFEWDGKDLSIRELFEKLKTRPAWSGDFEELVDTFQECDFEGIEHVHVETDHTTDVQTNTFRFWDEDGFEFFLAFESSLEDPARFTCFLAKKHTKTYPACFTCFRAKKHTKIVEVVTYEPLEY